MVHFPTRCSGNLFVDVLLITLRWAVHCRPHSVVKFLINHLHDCWTRETKWTGKYHREKKIKNEIPGVLIRNHCDHNTAVRFISAMEETNWHYRKKDKL